MLDESAQLVDVMVKKSPADLQQLMHISPALAELNFDRFQDWQVPFTKETARPAVLAFSGDVYLGLEAGTFSERDFTHAQKVFRILSGLYGVLRPLDLMMPYRLEMGSKVKNGRGNDLYSFWRNDVTKTLAADIEASPGANVLINLASNEYFGAVDPEGLGALSEVVIGEMRAIRGDLPGMADSFRISRSDALIAQFNDSISSVTLAALFLGLITLLGSSIGLTNIMLVTVTERTREIGLRKALGASSKTIQTQFLVEVVIIGLLGGIFGVALGIGVGNVVAHYLEAPFALPWGWIIISLVLSGVVGLVSGYYPARRAALLDPIESLRHA